MIIAFSDIAGEGWTGGANYLRNLFFALRSLEGAERPQIVLLAKPARANLSDHPLVDMVDKIVDMGEMNLRSSLFKSFLDRSARAFGSRTRHNFLAKVFREHEVNAFFSLSYPEDGIGIPVINWIPDFQHIHYPSFFSEKELEGRKRRNDVIARYADCVVLSSNHAKKDFSRLYPQCESKCRVLSFVAQIPDAVYEVSPEYVCRKYNIPEKYVLLPNQFWKHKNHITVIEALSQVVKRVPEITVVCTGNTSDHRHPAYFANLLSKVSLEGLRENFIFLGLVEWLDLMALMRQSIGVLQPSLFEGWNTAVEEAKSMGKPLLLSDIEVHREQASDGATYFDPHNNEKCADSLAQFFLEKKTGPDIVTEAKARKELGMRTVAFGRKFMEIVEETIGDCVQQ